MEIHHPSIVFSSPEESVPSPPQESIPTTQKSILTTPAPLPPASNTSNEESKYLSTVKLGDKERFDKEQIGVKEHFTDYQPFYIVNLLLDMGLLPI